MKLKTLLLIALFSFNAALHAEVVILTLDVGKVYEGYFRAQEATQKFSASVESAQEEIRQLVAEGTQFAEKIQEVIDKANNPALTKEARDRHFAEAEEMKHELRRMETSLNNYRTQTQQALVAREQSIFDLHLQDIKEAAKSIADSKGAGLVLNVNGLGVVYARAGMDVTAEVLARLNADAPSSN